MSKSRQSKPWPGFSPIFSSVLAILTLAIYTAPAAAQTEASADAASNKPTCAAPNIPRRNFKWECGEVLTSVQTPRPGQWKHVNGFWGYMSPQSTCIRDNLNPGRGETIKAVDQIYYNQERFPGNVIFQDSERVRWINIDGGSIAGDVVCRNCIDVEVDGVCYQND